jgi:hypothetical protein
MVNTTKKNIVKQLYGIVHNKDNVQIWQILYPVGWFDLVWIDRMQNILILILIPPKRFWQECTESYKYRWNDIRIPAKLVKLFGKTGTRLTSTIGLLLPVSDVVTLKMTET